jgi:hypothetical protein
MSGDAYFKEVVVNSIRVKVNSVKSRLGFIKMDFNKPRIVFIHPSSDGDRLFIFCDRRYLEMEYKRWKLGRVDEAEMKPLKRIIVKHITKEKTTEKVYPITDDEGRTLTLIFKCNTYSRIYMSFKRDGEEVTIENFFPEIEHKAIYL